MAARRADTAFAQARLQARHGAMPDEHAWHALEASRTAAHYLALARSGPLARWVEGMGDDADVHRIERELRRRWRRYVDEVARWLANRNAPKRIPGNRAEDRTVRAPSERVNNRQRREIGVVDAEPFVRAKPEA